MQIKIFGKNLFEVTKNRGGIFIEQANTQAKESKYLPDFSVAQSDMYGQLTAYVSVPEAINSVKATVAPKKEDKKVKLTPKGIHDLALLHDKTFTLNTDPVYVDQQISDFKDKLGLLKAEEYDMARGLTEISSVLMRLENRKKYPEVKDFFEQYPYTTTSKINEVVKENDYLQLGKIAQFLADMPKEAVEAMKNYNKSTDKICGKMAVFYIIADKKDFQKTEKRRDPILLAQSPFGHFWQILGAWDKEMLLLENL